MRILVLLAFAFMQSSGGCNGAGHHSVSLRWVASTTPGVGYNLYKSSGSGYSKVNPAPFLPTVFNDTAVLPNHSYSYYVTAVNSGGESQPSNTFSITVP